MRIAKTVILIPIIFICTVIQEYLNSIFPEYFHHFLLIAVTIEWLLIIYVFTTTNKIKKSYNEKMQSFGIVTQSEIDKDYWIIGDNYANMEGKEDKK